jgi:hypothetical protein
MSATTGPFGGGWNGEADWPAVRAGYPAKLKRGRRVFQVAVRLEPAGDLAAFSAAFSAVVGHPIGEPTDGDRSVLAVYDCSAKSLRAAISVVDFGLRRALKRAGLTDEVARLSFDARPVPVQEQETRPC